MEQHPTLFIIFGVTGDLARKKIIPALFHLYLEGYLPKKFRVAGFSRRDWSHDQFKAYLRPIIAKTHKRHSKQLVDSFLAMARFAGGTFEDASAYAKLRALLEELDIEIGVCANKLFHLATPPSFYETIAKQLARSGLTIPCGGPLGWTRVLVEKPFGRDLKTAERLDMLFADLFREEQIFRIDHYLGKQTVQNILAFRFSNALFEPIWNAKHIEAVEIILREKGTVAERGAFYDENGALRDVGQNHILQMLALVAMEDPGELDASAIRKARGRALAALSPIKPKELKARVVRGQYKGFRSEPEVAKRSTTETYFRIHAHLGSRRWKGVPFILEAGKALNEDRAEIAVHFKEKPSCVCELEDDQHLRNVLTFHLEPREGIRLRFWAKKPGYTMHVQARDLSFDYHEDRKGHPHDAYEQLLFDAIRGDQMRFASTDEVRASWEFVTPILKHWGALPLTAYVKGSAGPK